MPQDRTLKAIKSRSRSEQVSVVSLLLLPLLGMCCLLIPDTVTDALPYLLGGLMAVSGAAGLVYAVAHASGARADARRLAEEPAVLGRAVVMCVLGGVILVQGHASISFVGVMWPPGPVQGRRRDRRGGARAQGKEALRVEAGIHRVRDGAGRAAYHQPVREHRAPCCCWAWN